MLVFFVRRDLLFPAEGHSIPSVNPEHTPIFRKLICWREIQFKMTVITKLKARFFFSLLIILQSSDI